MSWILIVVLILVAWLVENVMHEVSHLFMAKIKGCVPLGLYPFPHWISYEDMEDGRWGYRWWRPWELWRKPWPGAKWYFARSLWKQPVKAWPPHTIIFISPVIWGLTLLVSTMVGSAVVRFHTLYLLPFAVVGLIDTLWWIRGYFWGSTDCDGKRWKNGEVA